MNRRRELLVNLALVAGSFLVILLAVEAFFRIFMAPPLYGRFEPIIGHGSIESDGKPDRGFYEQTPLGKRLKVQARGIIRDHHLSGRDIPLRTNEFGFRGPPVVFDDRLRVLFLGDSLTLGDYLVEEQTFVHLVETKSLDSTTPLQTINAGVGLVGVEEELNILRETGHLVEPDVVVLNLYLNDLQPSPALHLIPVPSTLGWSRTVQYVCQALSVLRFKIRGGVDQSLIPLEVLESWERRIARTYPARAGDWREDRLAYNQMILDWFGDWGVSYDEGGQKRILEISQEIIDLSVALGARPMVVLHPTRFQVEARFNADEPQRAFVKYMDEIGVPVLDLLPAMRESYASNPRPFFFDHCHHNVEGAALVADRIYAFIAASLRE